MARTRIGNNTFDNCSGDGISIGGTTNVDFNFFFLNNILSNNGGYGINFQNVTATYVRALGTTLTHNNLE